MHTFLHILGIAGIVVLGIIVLGVVGVFLLFAGDEANGGNPFQ